MCWVSVLDEVDELDEVDAVDAVEAVLPVAAEASDVVPANPLTAKAAARAMVVRRSVVLRAREEKTVGRGARMLAPSCDEGMYWSPTPAGLAVGFGRKSRPAA
jgi:hypothetical protein